MSTQSKNYNVNQFNNVYKISFDKHLHWFIGIPIYIHDAEEVQLLLPIYIYIPIHNPLFKIQDLH